MLEPYVEVTAVLPVCLHLDDRVFSLDVRGKAVEIFTRLIQSEAPTWVGSAKNAEVDSDDFSHFRFTVVVVRMPHDPRVAEVNDVLSAYNDLFFEVLNTFVACCSVALQRVGLRPHHNYGQFVRPVIATIVGPSNPEGLHTAAFSFGGGPLTSLRPLRTEDEHNSIQALLRQGVPLTTQFMADAKRYLYYHDAVHALLSAVIALEVAISGALRRVAHAKGLDSESIRNFLHDVGLTGNIKVTLRLIADTLERLPPDSVFSSCKGAITVRNAIMHEGRRSIAASQVRGWMPDLQTMVDFCDDLVI